MLDPTRTVGATLGLGCEAVGATSLLFAAAELVEPGRAVPAGTGAVLRERAVAGRGRPLDALPANVADGADILVAADEELGGIALFEGGLEMVDVEMRDGKPDDRAVSMDELLPVRDVGRRAVEALGGPAALDPPWPLDASTARNGALC